MLKHPVLAIHPVSDVVYEVSDLHLDHLSERRLWLFDLEATGLDTSRERVTQIAGVPLWRGRLQLEHAFASYVNPGPEVAISQEIQTLTGITPEKLAGAPPFSEAWRQCVAAADGCDLWIGQSVFEFDVPLLEAEFTRHRIHDALPAFLDTVVVATALLGQPEGRWSTSALIQRFGVDVEGLRRHDALEDVKILARILVPMLELLRRERADRLELPPGVRLPIRRHPPVQSNS